MLDYLVALRVGDFASARAIAGDLRTLYESTTIRPAGKLTLKIRAGLWLLTYPTVARLFLSMGGFPKVRSHLS